MGQFQGLLGVAFILFIGWFFSANKKRISWKQIVFGLGLQVFLGILILFVPGVTDVFELMSKAFVKITSFSAEGMKMLLTGFTTGEVSESAYLNFAFVALPTIIYFSALMSLLYYLGLLQKIVYVFAWIMKRTLGLSGAESLAAAGNVFLGQTEAPLLVKPFLHKMTKSEIVCLMTGGMATIAGSVLASYVLFLAGDDEVAKITFAKHLLTASIMNAPAAIILSKLLMPETEAIDASMDIKSEKKKGNVLDAISQGTGDGLRLAINVGAMLLVFTALVFLGNYMLSLVGRIGGLNDIIATNTAYDGLSFQLVLGYCLAPVAWMVGVESTDIVLIGQLLGEKTVLNEFIAYDSLKDMKKGGQISVRSITLATYMLCGFANFASMGIQIGGIGALEPRIKDKLSKYALRALLGGALASLLTAAIVGMMI